MELFLIGSFWFWIFLVLLPLFVIGSSVFYKSSAWAVLFSLATFGALAFLTDFHISTLWNHPWWTLTGVVGYVGVGMVWATWQWFILCRDKLKEYNVQKDEIIKRWDALNDSNKSGYTFAPWVSYNYSFPPSPSKHKEDITEWLAFWPISIIITFIGDYIARFFHWVYDYLASTFTRISNHVFKDSGLT